MRLRVAVSALLAAGSTRGVMASLGSFHEELTLHPLPDGSLSVSFDFSTYFDSSAGYHNELTPPSLLLPLKQNKVSELTISFVAGKWDQTRSGESGPLQLEAGGGGGEVRGWLGDGPDVETRWTSVTHALGGLFCAGLGPSEEESIKTFGDIYPPQAHDTDGLTHRLLSTPYLHLCTENLTPFLSLLPSKGHSGLSHLLAQPGIVFSWGFKTEGIEIIMPTDNQPGRWRGWWEGVVDLVPEKGHANRAFSLGSLFQRGVPRPFPEASSSILKLIKPDKAISVTIQPDSSELVAMDAREREVLSWNLLDERVQKKDIRFTWDEEDSFVYPRTFPQPPLSVHRTVTKPRAMDGVFTITIQNNDDVNHEAIYSEIWPWWVNGWISEMETSINGVRSPEALDILLYHPSTPPKPTTTTIHLSVNLPAYSRMTITIPFTKLTLKYTEHRPDAERGREMSSGVLTILDQESEPASTHLRPRIYTSRLLLDVPTPDFSMPYNVIIMSSTVMAVFFGLMHGSLTRRWGWVELPAAVTPAINGKAT